MGDQITATCNGHQIPNPASGAPQPGPPFPFAAPLLTKLATTVMIGGKAAAIEGSEGVCTPPHVGLHPSDSYMTPTQQKGAVSKGSTSVLFDGKGAAKTGSTTTVCFSAPGMLSGSASDVLIGG